MPAYDSLGTDNDHQTNKHLHDTYHELGHRMDPMRDKKISKVESLALESLSLRSSKEFA